MAEILTLYNNPTGTGRTLTWEQGESGSHTYDLIIIDQTGQPVDLTGCSVALYFKPPSGTVQIGAAVSSSGDSAFLTVPGEATQSPGTYQAWVAVVRPSPQQNIIINNLAIIIRANVVDASAPEAEPYFGELAQMIADGQQAINDLEALIPVSVANGGTGASTAAGARANLSAAAAGHTHSLSGSSITDILPASKGGTGATTAKQARMNLEAASENHSHDLTSENITGINPISKGGTGATTAEGARTNIGIGTQLWSGSWSTGQITVPNLTNYTMFYLDVSDSNTLVPAFRENSSLRGSSGYFSSNDYGHLALFDASVSGNTLTYGHLIDISISRAGSLGFSDDLEVVAIYGIF